METRADKRRKEWEYNAPLHEQRSAGTGRSSEETAYICTPLLPFDELRRLKQGDVKSTEVDRPIIWRVAMPAACMHACEPRDNIYAGIGLPHQSLFKREESPLLFQSPHLTMKMALSLQKYPIADDIQTWVLKELWLTPATSPRASSLGMLPYFNYYSTLCQLSSRNGGVYISANSHQDLVDVTKQILLRDATRDDLHSSLYANCPKDEHGEDRSGVIYSTLDLCGSLLLMAEVGERKLTFPPVNHLVWSGPQTLRQAVEKHFRPEKKLQSESPKLGMEFTVRNLAVMGGMKVRWTNNIVDHLLLSDDDQTVFIFHHVGFLRFLRGYV